MSARFLALATLVPQLRSTLAKLNLDSLRPHERQWAEAELKLLDDDIRSTLDPNFVRRSERRV